MVQSQQLRSLTIGQLASTTGVGVETVRFYQRKGLLDVPPGDAGIRRYGSDHVRRLRFIRQAQSAGFTLAEIGQLLELDLTRDHERARTLATARIAALDQKITELEEVRSALRRLARECSGSTDRPCPILESFVGQSPRSRSLK